MKMTNEARMVNKKKTSSKGVAALIVAAFVVLAAIVVVEGIIISNYLVKSENIVRAIREEAIIQGINNVEFAKRGLSQAVLYSFNQAAYDIGTRGGYFDIPTGISYNCVPYWKIFSTSYVPNDFESELSQNVLRIFNSYGTSLDIDIPKYDSVTFDKTRNSMTLTSSGKLSYEQQDFFTVRDSANFVQSADMKIFKMFDAAEDIEGQLDSKVSSASSYPSALDAVVSVASAAGQKYSADGIQVSIQPSGNLGKDDSNFAVRILISLQDSDASGKKLVYDFSENSLQTRSLQFRYYVILGNYNIDPQTSSCGKIKY